MRSVEAPENSVPIGIIALSAEQQMSAPVAGFNKALFLPLASLQVVELARNIQHFLVQQIRLRIFGEESAPNPAAQKRTRIGRAAQIPRTSGESDCARTWAATTPSFPNRKRQADRLCPADVRCDRCRRSHRLEPLGELFSIR